MPEKEPVQHSPIDLLRLFREDLDPEKRTEAFIQATQVVSDEITRNLDNDELREEINNRFDIKVILNSHGDGINATQSLSHLNEPFITFVEGTGAEETQTEPVFAISVNNAFDMSFNNAPPRDYIYPPRPDGAWHYFRDRGLLKKASVIAPVDIRVYAYRLLEALMGQDYSQDFLNQRMQLDELKTLSPDKLTDKAVDHGRLVMHSNALREHTSALQIVSTLRDLLRPVEDGTDFSDTDEKLRALYNRHVRQNPKTEVGVIYGTGHFRFPRLLQSFGVEVDRTFANKDEEDKPFKYVGNNLDPFFGGYAQGYSPEKLRQLGRAYVLESLLLTPLSRGEEYDCMPVTHLDNWVGRRRVTKVARQMSDQESFEGVIEGFHDDKRSLLPILRGAGVALRDI